MATPAPAKRKVWPWIVGGVVALVIIMCFGLVIGGALMTGDPKTKPTTAAPATTTPPVTTQPTTVSPAVKSPVKKKPVASFPGTFGDGDWVAGKHVQTGTYRTEGASSSLFSICSYTVYGVDGEIINGGVSNQNEPMSATLKLGQSIESRGCETWKLEG